MLRCAIYARFSTDRQSQTSAEDQERVCRERADREGWQVAAVFKDPAMSGATIHRPDMTKMLADVREGRFDIVLAEALDRLARDQEDISHIFKRVRHAGAKIVTLSQGEISELHVGLAGTMDALELKKHAEKVRRGARGALSRGLIPGGRCYGYEPDLALRPDGTVDRGRRRIVPEEAAIVVRIATEYVASRSPIAIAKGLNTDGIPAPLGGEWRATTIIGNASRQIGILHNPIYVGRFVWNRVHMVRDPDTRKRLSRVNASKDVETIEVPELRILSDELWGQIQTMRAELAKQPLVYRRRPKHFLSCLVKCHHCGGNYTLIDRGRWGCSRHRAGGTCDNGKRIAVDELETRVLAGLQEKLLSEEALRRLSQRFHQQAAKRRGAADADRTRLERIVREADRAIGNYVAAIGEGAGAFARVKEALAKKQAERDRAEAQLAEMEATSVIILHPQIIAAYRARILNLAADLRNRDLNDGTSAGQVRSLIDRVVVTPTSAGNDIEVFGSLHAALGLTGTALPSGRGARLRRGGLMVAEEGLEPPTPGL